MMLRQLFTIVVVMLMLTACTGQSKEELLQSGIGLLEAGNARGSIVYLRSALEKDQNFYEARYHLANAYMRSGRLEIAESEFRKVSLQSSSFADLPLKLAEIYLLTSRNELAAQTLEKFHSGTSPTSESLDIKGRLSGLSGDYTEADKSFQKAMDLDSENPYPKIHLAESLLNQSMDEGAYQLLLVCVEQHQKFTPGYELLARLELKRKQPTRAKNIYQHIYNLDPMNVNALYMQGFISLMSGLLEKSISVAEKLSTEFPNDYRTRLLRGLISYRQEEFDNALVDLLASLKINQNSLAYYFLGLSYFRLGDFELSINQFQKVLDLKPNLSQARLMLAMIYLRQKRIDDSIREVSYVITNDEHNGLAYNILGSAQLLRKDFDAALRSFDQAIETDPTLGNAYLNKSHTHIITGETELAEAVLKDALTLSPDILNARLILAGLNVHQENYMNAVDILKEGLAGTPDDAFLYNYIAGIFLKQKDDQAALSNLKMAKSADPEYLTPLFNLASYYLAKGEYGEAISEFLSILSKRSSNLKALVGLSLAYELTGQEALASSIYERMLESENPKAVLHVSQKYIRNNRQDEALVLIDHALRRTPSYAPLYELKTFILLNTGQTDKALSVLETLEKLEPGKGYPKLVSILLKQGQNLQAEKIAEKVIKDNPKANYGYLLQASIFETRRQFERAMESLEQGLSILPGDPRLSLKLGRVYEQKGNTEEAEGVYLELVSSNPGYYPGVFSLGAFHDRLGNKKEAQAYYQKTIAINDRYVPALNNLAYLYADNYGDNVKALQLSLQAYRLDPEQQDVMDTLGYVLLKNNKADEAVIILKKANEADIYNPTISYHLALAYIELKQNEKAIAELEKSLEIDDFPDADRCKRLLAKLKT